ncbi:universal stress protein [Flavobacterium sp. CS20]|uniref:universal stress protein n=1 Tax=Flavobacterium sp. CS20 TaxID=2775246 RepID=UPI001B3A608B|nr:universal stress protein [Flavobacterium sp. CS20]QTY25839.1 universal stress protein [Flavobacterium sp. CS20]
MDTFKNILVALDLSSLDDTLIKYANYLSENFDVEKVYFVHNIKKYEISEIIEQEIKDIDLEEAINEELKEQISKVMNVNSNWELLISDDPYTESLINYISQKYHINTVLLGNKNGEKGSGLVGFKLLRILKSNVLWIPKLDSIDIKKVWVSTDFSNSSKKAFQVSSLVQDRIKAKTQAVHVFNVPLHFSPYINSSKIETKVENHVQKKFENFIKKLNYPHELETVLIAGREANATSKIRLEAKKHKISFLIVADKGANTFSSLMVGSVTEELFNRDLYVPLFITKTQQ